TLARAWGPVRSRRKGYVNGQASPATQPRDEEPVGVIAVGQQLLVGAIAAVGKPIRGALGMALERAIDPVRALAAGERARRIVAGRARPSGLTGGPPDSAL